MTKEKVLAGIMAAKVVAVIRMKDAARLAEVAAALRRGGVNVLEVTMTVPGAVEIIRAMARAKAPGTLVGAGTVLDAGTATDVIAAGADFVVSPITDREMVSACRDAGRSRRGPFAADDVVVRRTPACAPCYSRSCTRHAGVMDASSLDEVRVAVERRLALARA